jgi:hypothetical protein
MANSNTLTHHCKTYRDFFVCNFSLYARQATCYEIARSSCIYSLAKHLSLLEDTRALPYCKIVKGKVGHVLTMKSCRRDTGI